MKIVLDTDIGTDVDDCLALALALASPEIELAAVTTVYGNVGLRARMALKLLGMAGRKDVPVAAGAARPLLGKRDVYWAGWEGAGLLAPEDDKIALSADRAADLIIRLALAEPGRVTVVAIGPLTNVAIALIAEPRLADALAGITVMGGAIGGIERRQSNETSPAGVPGPEPNLAALRQQTLDEPAEAPPARSAPRAPGPHGAAGTGEALPASPREPGRAEGRMAGSARASLHPTITVHQRVRPVTLADLPWAEHNFKSDPEAAAVVLASGAPLTVVPLDVTSQIRIRPDDVERIRGRGDTFHEAVADQVQRYLRYTSRGWTNLHDPLALATLVEPGLVHVEPLHAVVETGGEYSAGRLLARLPGDGGPANARIALNVDAERAERFIIERIADAPA